MNLVRIIDVCQGSDTEVSFVRELHVVGLIEIIRQDDMEYVDEEELPQLERYVSWCKDLELNIQGIEVVNHLLQKIELLQEELRVFRS